MASQDELGVADALELAREPVEVDASGERAANAPGVRAPSHDSADGERAVPERARRRFPGRGLFVRVLPRLVVGWWERDVPQERVVVAVGPADVRRRSRERALHAKYAVEEDVDAEVSAETGIGLDGQDLAGAAFERRVFQSSARRRLTAPRHASTAGCCASNDSFVFGYAELDVMFGRTAPLAARAGYTEFLREDNGTT